MKNKATLKGGHPRFHEIVEAMSSLHDKKNTDYAAGTKEGPLGNFMRVSQIMRLYPGFDWTSPFGVAMAFMLKQFDAGFTLRAQKRQSVTGEPIAARLTDVAVYAVLGIILEEDEKSKITPKRTQVPKMPESISTPKAHKRRRLHAKRYRM